MQNILYIKQRTSVDIIKYVNEFEHNLNSIHDKKIKKNHIGYVGSDAIISYPWQMLWLLVFTPFFTNNCQNFQNGLVPISLF